MDRRDFVWLSALTLGGVVARSPEAAAQARRNADLAFYGGPVVTMDSARPVAEAVAVRAGRVILVGSQAQVQAVCDRGTQMVDLGGRTLTPGLIDAHSHLSAFGHMELFFVKIRPPQVHDFDSLRRVLAAAAQKLPRGAWIVARGFNEFDEERFPFRWDVDPATPNNPALLIHWTGQYGVANTLALQEADLFSPQAQDPYGGKFLRDRQGVPDGRLLHYPAIYAVHQPRMTPEEEYRAVLWGAQRFIEQGVTCVHDNFASQRSNIAYVTAERQGELPLRLRLYPYVANLQHCQQMVQRLKRYEGPLVRVQGVKLAVDGYPLMYKVLPQHQQINMPMHPADQFQAIVSTIHRGDLQVDVHAAGDRGVDLTLEAFSKAAGGDRAVRDRRHRIEHYMFYRQESIDRTADMGVPVCTQPAWIDMRAADMARRLGPEPVAKMVPLGSFREAGVAICFGADVCASPTHLPMDSIIPAVRRDPPGNIRLDPSERLTFLEALEAHTLTAAYAAFDEGDMGSITPGKVADFAVWDHDLRQVNEANVQQQQVVATYVGGKQVWRA